MNTITLVTRNGQLNQEVIDMLEGLLVDAREGKLVSFAYAAVAPDGSAYTGSSSSDNIITLIGAVGILQYRVIDEQRQTT